MLVVSSKKIMAAGVLSAGVLLGLSLKFLRATVSNNDNTSITSEGNQNSSVPSEGSRLAGQSKILSDPVQGSTAPAINSSVNITATGLTFPETVSSITTLARINFNGSSLPENFHDALNIVSEKFKSPLDLLDPKISGEAGLTNTPWYVQPDGELAQCFVFDQANNKVYMVSVGKGLMSLDPESEDVVFTCDEVKIEDLAALYKYIINPDLDYYYEHLAGSDATVLNTPSIVEIFSEGGAKLTWPVGSRGPEKPNEIQYDQTLQPKTYRWQGDTSYEVMYNEYRNSVEIYINGAIAENGDSAPRFLHPYASGIMYRTVRNYAEPSAP